MNAADNSLIDRKVSFSLHLSYYGKLLTETQRMICGLYADEDESMGEIAADLHISRQSVFDTLARAEKVLMDFENRLHLIAKNEETETLIEKCLILLGNVVPSEKTKQDLETAKQYLCRLKNREEENGL